MHESMTAVAPMLQIAGRENRERVRLLPLLMKVSPRPNVLGVFGLRRRPLEAVIPSPRGLFCARLIWWW